MSEQTDVMAIRAWIVGKLTEWINNTEPEYVEVSAAAVDAVRRLGLSAPGTLQRQLDRQDAVKPVGDAVVEVIRTWLRAEISGGDDRTKFLAGLLEDLLDLGDGEQVRLLGKHYLPEESEWP